MLEFTILGQQTSMMEVLGIITGLLGVWLTARRNILCFPVGIINVSLYACMFSSEGVRLYADALLQWIYFILLAYGWIMWMKNRKSFNTEKPETQNFTKKLIYVSFAAFLLLSFFLEKFTNASLPWLDSALTILSLVAQWMIARKMIANWIIWILVDLVYIPLYFYKGLPLTAVLYFVFLLMAIKGYIDWKRNPSLQQTD